EHGVRVRSQKVGGRSTLSVHHIKDLMLTEKTRVFKIGLFIGVEDHEDPDILVCDQQRQFSDAVAAFFISDFLGCRLAAEPHVLTRDFMECVELWINTEVTDAARKSKYELALLAELGSNRRTLTPRAFAHDYLDPHDRDRLISSLNRSGAPIDRFRKDLALVQRRLARVRFDFDNKVAVIAPPEAIGRSVQIEDISDNRTRVSVEGKL